MLLVLFFSAVFKEKLRDSRRHTNFGHKSPRHKHIEFLNLAVFVKHLLFDFTAAGRLQKTFIGSWNCFHPPMDQNQQRFASIGDFLWLQEDSGSRRRHSTNN